MSALKTEKRQLELELSNIQKKQHKSQWYYAQKKETSDTSVSIDNLSSKKGQKGTSRHSPVHLFTPPFSRNCTSPEPLSVEVISRKRPAISPPPGMSSSSSCLTTPSPQPIGMPPVTPDTSASPRSLSESFEQPNDVICLSSDKATLLFLSKTCQVMKWHVLLLILSISLTASLHPFSQHFQ